MKFSPSDVPSNRAGLLPNFDPIHLPKPLLNKLKTPAVIPFSIAPERPLRPVLHMAGFLPLRVAVFDHRDASKDDPSLRGKLMVNNAKLGAALAKRLRGVRYSQQGRIAWRKLARKTPAIGRVLVISAGTADLPVAEEAAVSAELMGNRVERLYDVGVAGLHRLLERRQRLWEAAVVIVVAGMEGALPSVVGPHHVGQ